MDSKGDNMMDFFDKKDLIYLIILWILTLSTVFFAVKYNTLKKTAYADSVACTSEERVISFSLQIF